MACSVGSDFKKAQNLEKKGHPYEAWLLYQKVALKGSKSPLAPEALFRAGLLAERHLKDCQAAKVFFDSVLDKYPTSDPWAKRASLQKDACPDYFPLYPGAAWVEGDSETLGKNARVESVAEPDSSPATVPNESGRIRKTFFAGANKFQTVLVRYERKNSELLEYPATGEPSPKIILRWPILEGASWSTKFGGQIFRYAVVSSSMAVKVAASQYFGCLKIQSSIDGLSGYKNEYYAPYVGRVLTTVSQGDVEKRNTELLSFKPASILETEGQQAR